MNWGGVDILPSFALDDATVVKPYTFKMSEIESFRYRAHVSDNDNHVTSILFFG